MKKHNIKSKIVYLVVLGILTGAVSLNAGKAKKPQTAVSQASSAVAVAVTTGWTHTCALLNTGEMKCWGRNRFGRLGTGTTRSYSVPASVAGMTDVKSISAGGEHTCAVTKAGAAKCWGSSQFGQVGDGTTMSRYSPADVKGLDKGVKDIAAGVYHSCAVTDSGGVKCWGQNVNGRLGDSTIYNRTAPVDVYNLSSGAVQLAAGMDHTCALMQDGKVKCWGSNYHGQMGKSNIGYMSRSLFPVDVEGLEGGIKSISTGWFHTCALTGSGSVKCWGRNYNGELGDGSRNKTEKPVDVKGVENVVAIDAWGENTCAAEKSGKVKCWGANVYGQLGNGGTENQYKPSEVVGIDGVATGVAVGWRHGCALMQNGQIKCWGYNRYGVIGNGTGGSSFTAKQTKL